MPTEHGSLPRQVRNRGANYAFAAGSGMAITLLLAIFSGGLWDFAWRLGLFILCVGAVAGVPAAVFNPRHRVESAIIGGVTAFVVIVGYVFFAVSQIS